MLTPKQVLDNYFLDARSMLVELAAIFDRYDRALEVSENQEEEDLRLEALFRACAILADRRRRTDRAETLLNLFSELAEQ